VRQGPTRVAVVGAGLAGLVAARELRRHGVEVAVFEAGPRVAGLAASHRDEDGFSYDTGAHFVTNRLAAALGVGDQCRDVHRYGESVFLDGRSIGYPFGLLRVPRFVRSAAAGRLRRGGPPPASAADQFAADYGRALAEEVADPLLEAWSGAPASELSPAVADKLPSGLGRTVALKLSPRLTGRATAVGYCRTQPEHVNVWHVYPEHGVATLCQRVADELGDVVRLRSPVERILVEHDRVAGVRVGGEDWPADGVVSTAPVHVLPKLVEGTDRLDHLAEFRYRPMIFVNLRFDTRPLLPDVVMWVPQREHPFFRLTEAPLSMPWLAPEGKTVVTADIGAEVGDEHWTMDDEAIGRHCVDHLEVLVPGAAARYLGCRVVKTPLAYPVFLNAYEQQRRAFERSSGVDGLLSVGRNGEFAHILMEDVYWRTRRRIDAWVEGAPWP
jgi:protoporphyrinogen/coproporphyrinogen III oxidase